MAPETFTWIILNLTSFAISLSEPDRIAIQEAFGGEERRHELNKLCFRAINANDLFFIFFRKLIIFGKHFINPFVFSNVLKPTYKNILMNEYLRIIF